MLIKLVTCKEGYKARNGKFNVVASEALYPRWTPVTVKCNTKYPCLVPQPPSVLQPVSPLPPRPNVRVFLLLSFPFSYVRKSKKATPGRSPPSSRQSGDAGPTRAHKPCRFTLVLYYKGQIKEYCHLQTDPFTK